MLRAGRVAGNAGPPTRAASPSGLIGDQERADAALCQPTARHTGPQLLRRHTAHAPGSRATVQGMLEVRGAELLEREDELRELDRAVGDACAGRGRLVLIEGPPGIG